MNISRSVLVGVGCMALALGGCALKKEEQVTTHSMVMTRTFDAPIEKVWKAWSDGDEVKKWWGPSAFTCPECRMDFRVGGSTIVCMRAPKEFGGMDLYNTWTYTKIVPNQRMEFTLHFTDKNGKRLDPAAMGMPPGIPAEVPHEVTFKKVGSGSTEMTVTERGYGTEQAVAISKSGLSECLDKMEASFTKQ